MVSEKQLRTGAWYGDQPLTLHFPAEWDVTILWPRTPPPLTDAQIIEVLERPIGQPPIRQLCQRKSRPLVIVDDLNRPTPAARVMPFLLKHFQHAGISARDVRILIATGTHGAPQTDAILKKIGPAPCQLLVHDANRNIVRIGRTSFGTPVTVNKEVTASDFMVGIGGIYPNHTAGFGGGSKLALGVLGVRSIIHLHYGHKSVGWGSCEVENGFRKDLDEIARMIRLNTMISLHVNGDREVVRMISGDHLLYYKDEVAFARQAFTAPMPEHADVVVSNAYPTDLSLTFVHMKGTTPLRHCGSGVSRIAVAPCSEGVGHHGLFPFVNIPRFHRERYIARRISVMSPQEIARKIAVRFNRELRAKFFENRMLPMAEMQTPLMARNPIWLYRPENHSEMFPSQIAGIRITDSWSEILQAVRREQGDKERLKVLLYPCAPLQCFDASRVPPADLCQRLESKEA